MQEFLQESPKEASHLEDQESGDQGNLYQDQEEMATSKKPQPLKAGTIVRNRKASNQNQAQKQASQVEKQIVESQVKIGKYQQKIEQYFELLQGLLSSQINILQELPQQKESGEQIQQEILQYALDQQQHDLITEEAIQAKNCLQIYRLSQNGKPELKNLYLEKQKKLEKLQSPKSDSQQKHFTELTQEKDDYLLDELQYLLQENNQIQQELQQVDLKMNEVRQNLLAKSLTNFRSETEQQIWENIGIDYLNQRDSWNLVENYENITRELESAFDQKEQKTKQFNNYLKELNRKKQTSSLYNTTQSFFKPQYESLRTSKDNFYQQGNKIYPVDQSQKEKELCELQVRNKIFQLKLRRDVLYRTYVESQK